MHRHIFYGIVVAAVAAPMLAESQRRTTDEPPAAARAQLSDRALIASTVAAGTQGGGPGPQVVTVPSSFSLSLTSSLNLRGSLFKSGVPFMHNDGGPSFYNTGLGINALVSLSPGLPYPASGSNNSAFGALALRNTTSGGRNTATGVAALYSNTSGTANTADGYNALGVTNGYGNTAIGAFAAGSTTTGGSNTALGRGALLFNTSGSNNTAVGDFAGYEWTTGSNNVAVGFGAFGVGGESGAIRIGGGDLQTKTYIEGVNAVSLVGYQVCVNADDQLAKCLSQSSSRDLKLDIHPMPDLSGDLDALEPVSFRYRGDPRGTRRYGLIAEEVAEVFPALVIRDREGKPWGIDYELLTPLLLQQVQQQAEELGRLRALALEVADLRRVMEIWQSERDNLAKSGRRRNRP